MEKQELALCLEEDLNEIARLIWGYMDQKYISQLKGSLAGYRQQCESNLCKEAQLLKALMPFMKQEEKMLQLVLDAIVYNDMIDRSFEEHEMFHNLYRDENKDKEKMKKLVYKLIAFKIITMVEQIESK